MSKTIEELREWAKSKGLECKDYILPEMYKANAQFEMWKAQKDMTTTHGK